MRAIRVNEFGGPDAAKLADLEAPRAGPDEIRIRVRAAGVNFADTLMVRGKYQATPSLPFTPGMEVAGDVVEAGANIKWFKPGDRAIAVLDHRILQMTWVCVCVCVCARVPGVRVRTCKYQY